MIYKCEVCGKEFDTLSGAIACESKCKAEETIVKPSADALANSVELAVERVNDCYDDLKDLYDERKELDKEIEEVKAEREMHVNALYDKIAEFKKAYPSHKVEITNNNGFIEAIVKEINPDVDPNIEFKKADLNHEFSPGTTIADLFHQIFG